MNICYLQLGSNIGNRQEYLQMACEAFIENDHVITKRSSIYETEPWGFESDDYFLNQVIEIETKLNPSQLLAFCQRVELQNNRIRKTKRYASRTLDIDILLFNHDVINSHALTIPHKEMANRRFVLEPLNEITPDYQHPVLHKTINELWNKCSDYSVVKKV